MAQRVQTPIGEEVVLTPEEFGKPVAGRDLSKYVKQEDGTYLCRDCKVTILAAQVAHPIWDGPFPLSGNGRVHYEEVPYCPQCEKKPSFHGSPISPKGSYHNP